MSTWDDSLYWACFHSSKHQALVLANQNNVNYVDPDFDDTPLHQACIWHGWLDVVKLFIEKYGCDPNVKTKSNESLLHYACQYGSIDIVKYLINEQHLNPLLTDNINQLEPLDYALHYNQTDTAVYLCQHCISSDEMLNPNRIKTTINLIKYIFRNNPWPFVASLRVSENMANPLDPRWKTADGDNILQLVGSSKTCISHMPTAVVWEIFYYGIAKFNPDWKTADDDNLLELACQSETFLSNISSALILEWLGDATFNKVRKSIPDSKTADGDTLIQLVCQSETCISHISTAVLSKWLSDTTLIQNVANMITSKWKTANGDTLFQLVLQSSMPRSRISLRVLLKLLNESRDIPVTQMKMVDPYWKTLDGTYFLYALCQSNIEDKKVIELMQYYILENSWNPDSDYLDSDHEGNTALHIACQVNKLALVSYLIDQAHCDPNIENKKGSLPLDMTTNLEVIKYLCQHDRVAVYSKTIMEWMKSPWSIDNATMLCIVQSLVDNHRTKTQDGSTLLHVVCTCIALCDTKSLVDYLLSEYQCDPNCLDSKGKMPLQLTSDSDIMKTLVEHGAKMTTDVVFKVISEEDITESEAVEVLALSLRKGSMLWNPTDVNSNGKTALDFAYTLNLLAIVNYLLAEAKCHLSANNLLKSLLELTTNLKTAKLLIKHGARVTPELVLRFEDMENEPNKHALIKLMLTTWNPHDKDSDGYTALHLACKANRPTTVNLLLSVGHCDPNSKSSSEEVPLQMTTNPEIIKDLIRHGAKTSIMYKSYKKALGTNKPVQPSVKVFIVGNPSVGKSTLTAALKTEKSIVARLFSSGKISGVDVKTVGIVPHDLESGLFGRVTLYDFAGHREFYSGHAALLQTAIQSTPPIFLLVINLCENTDEIIKNILYWISFLENQCASVSCKPHVILVGSHADILRLKGVNPMDEMKMIVDSLDTKCFTNMEFIGFVAMNCQFHESTGMSDLRRLLIKSCQELRIHEPITFNAHCFLIYLIDKFIDLTAVTIKTVSETINHQKSKEGGVLEFLPPNFEELYKICLELNDRGHILLLKDRTAVENSYIIIDKEFLLSKISGAVFAPEGFKQYKELSTNTGVVPLSKITSCLSEFDKDLEKDLGILVGFLTHLEFCHEILDHSLHQLICEQYSQVSGERYYLFPGLISLKADDTVWQMQSEYDYNFGWILKCIHLEQFFSSRFLQVLLLRLAFSFALEASGDNANQSIGIHRNCHLWKNGIFWGSVLDMQTLVEVTSDNKSVILLARFRKANILQCIHLRSAVISTILQCKEQFCPRVIVSESFVDSSSPPQYPLNPADTHNICTLQHLATVAVRADCKHPAVVFPCSTVSAEIVLSFEPYLEMNLSTIQELWDEKNEIKVIEKTFFPKFVQEATDELSSLIKIFSGSSTSSTSENQLYQDLLRWRDSDKTNQKTYKELRQMVDQYSVFAGRNVLKLAGKLPNLPIPIPMENEKDDKQQCKLIVNGIKPKLNELQFLKFPDGNALRIIDTVAPKWKQVAIALGFDGPKIKAIEMGAHYQPGDACLKMFIDWLSRGRALTWDSLIQSLRAANLTETADLLSSTIEIGAEDEVDSTLSAVVLDSESSSTVTPDVIVGNVKVESSKCENDQSLKIDMCIDSEPTGSPKTDLEQGSMASISTTVDIQALEVIKGRGGREVRVIESIGSEWEEVAKALDMGQEDIDMIKTTHSDNDEEACREMLATWLEGNDGEVSWTAFTQALIDAGLSELADSVKDVLVL